MLITNKEINNSSKDEIRKQIDRDQKKTNSIHLEIKLLLVLILILTIAVISVSDGDIIAAPALNSANLVQMK